ncbi:hypothetical protein B0H13DRAFT_2392737 [Mycena leptocephala]|nr:hypothetical protein B0H13DRAFT_2392737 [Mycena leptocephala]
MPDFPQELVDEILDHIWESSYPPSWRIMTTESLRNMAAVGLVCKQWLPRSRVHLFSRVVLRPETVPSFFGIVGKSSSLILPSIQTLDLNFGDDCATLLNEEELSRFSVSSKLATLWIRIPQQEEIEEMQTYLGSKPACR